MSDDEELVYVKRPRTIHYGSLEESERQRQSALEDADGGDYRMETSNGPPTNPSEYFNLDEEVYVHVNAIENVFLTSRVYFQVPGQGGSAGGV